MGTIKAALQAENNEFITLHELLESLQQVEDGCTLEEAGQYLYRAIDQMGFPDFCFFDICDGIEVATDDELTRSICFLEEVALGHYKAGGDGSVFGFRRTEIERFLEANGVSLRLSNDASNAPLTDAELLGKYQDVEQEKARLQQENDRLTAEIEQLKNKSVGTRQLNNLLTVIAAACEYGRLDFKTPAKTAGVIRQTMSGMGVDVGETTIEGYLKKIPKALEDKATK